jgi:hypothetical protein
MANAVAAKAKQLLENASQVIGLRPLKAVTPSGRRATINDAGQAVNRSP